MAVCAGWVNVAGYGLSIPAHTEARARGGCCDAGGVGLGRWNADMRLAERLPSEWETKRIVVSGYLCDLPTPGSFDSLRFGFCVLHWQAPGVSVDNNLPPRVLRLSWYGREGGRRLPDHRLTLEVTLKRPQGNLNPDGFRYEDWLFRHGYRATGSVKQVSAAPELSCALQCQYHAWHWRASKKLQRWFGEAEYYPPLIASLLMGNRGGSLEDHHWQVLKSTGTIHLVAISGLHLGLVAVGVGLLARWGGLLLLPVGGLSEQGGRRSLVFLVVVLSCLVYSLLAGFTVPTAGPGDGGCRRLVSAQGKTAERLATLCAGSGSGASDGSVCASGPGFLVVFWRCRGGAAGGIFRASGFVGLVVGFVDSPVGGLCRVVANVDAGASGPTFCRLRGQSIGGAWVSFAVMPVLFLGGAIIALFSGGGGSCPGCRPGLTLSWGGRYGGGWSWWPGSRQDRCSLCRCHWQRVWRCWRFGGGFAGGTGDGGHCWALPSCCSVFPGQVREQAIPSHGHLKSGCWMWGAGGAVGCGSRRWPGDGV